MTAQSSDPFIARGMPLRERMSLYHVHRQVASEVDRRHVPPHHLLELEPPAAQRLHWQLSMPIGAALLSAITSALYRP